MLARVSEAGYLCVARHWSERSERTESARARLQPQQSPDAAPSREAARQQRHQQRHSVRGEVERRLSVQPAGAEQGRAAAAAATAVLTEKCEAAKQRPKTSDKGDKLVKVLSGIFSLTDNF